MTGPAGPVRIAVVGGGITGLAAAHRLLELSAQRRVPVALTLCEAGPRLGGTIATERRDGYLIEAGPDAFLTEKPWALDLCTRLGLALVGTRPTDRRTFVVRGGRLHPLPDGFALLAPTRARPLLRSGLFSWRGKARMALDLLLPPRRAEGDESLARFVTRRLGREALERAAQPMVAGIYTADPEALSLAATMPRFLEMERRYGSVIRGLRRAPSGAPDRSGPRWSLFAAPACGMEALVAALASRLPARAVRLHTRVTALGRAGPPDGGGPAGPYRIELHGGSTLWADGVILALEAHHAADLVAGTDPDLTALLRGIPYASSAAVTLAYRREEIAHPLDGFGFVVPRVERRPVLACTFSSVKFPDRAPRGRVLLRVFLGGALWPGVLERDDGWIARTAAGEVAALLGAAGAPHLVRVHRHPRAMPQYLVGHLERASAIEARAARSPGLALAGAAYRGVGIPDCIRSGEDAAERVLREAAGRPARAGADPEGARRSGGK